MIYRMSSLNGLNYNVKLINFKPILISNVLISIMKYSFFILYLSVDSSRQKSLLAVQFIGSIVLRLLCYTSIITFFYFNATTSAISLDLLKPELRKLPWIETILAFPSAAKGDLSAIVWALICFGGMSCLLNFLKQE
jgi:hypothetical protein